MYKKTRKKIDHCFYVSRGERKKKKKKTQRDTTDHDKTNIFLSATRKSSRKNSFAVNEGQRNYKKKRARIPLQLSFNITRFIYIYIYILIYYNSSRSLTHSHSLTRSHCTRERFFSFLISLARTFSRSLLSLPLFLVSHIRSFFSFFPLDIHDSYEVLLSFSRVPFAVRLPTESQRTVSRRRRRFVSSVTIYFALLPRDKASARILPESLRIVKNSGGGFHRWIKSD